MVYSRPLTDRITYVIQSDFGVQGSARPLARPTGSNVARWYGINQYMLLQDNDQWAWGSTANGSATKKASASAASCRTTPTPPTVAPAQTGYPASGTAPGGGVVAGAGGFAGNFYQFTMGPRWNPRPNIMVRPNVRIDWYSGANGTHGSPDPTMRATRRRRACSSPTWSWCSSNAPFG